MPDGSRKILSRKICNPLCCSNLQSKNSGSPKSKTSSESTCTLQYNNCDMKKKQNLITENWHSVGRSEIGILDTPSDSYIVEKTVIGIAKLDFCFKIYQLKLKLLFIDKFFNMDNLTRELHREASIRVITKCVESFFNKDIIWSLEMLKWNFDQKYVLEEFSNTFEVFDSSECDKFVDHIVVDKNANLESNIKEVSDKINNGNNVSSAINFEENIEDKELSIEDNIIVMGVAQCNGGSFKDQMVLKCSETTLSSIKSEDSEFKTADRSEIGVLMLHFVISKIILKKKNQVWWKIVINYCECQLKESRLELLRNAKIKIKRGKFQIASNLVKSNISLVEIQFKQWAFWKMNDTLHTRDNFGNNHSEKTLENVFPSGIIANIPFLNQTPFLDLAVKSAIHK